MRRIGTAVVVAALGLAAVPGVQAPPPPPPPNPFRVAILRWALAIQGGEFATGSGPYGVAFDGDHVWVANSGSDTVTKLRSNDGTILGTFHVGWKPSYLAFDGAHVWVTNVDSGEIMKLRASDGTTLGVFYVPDGPRGSLSTASTSGWPTMTATACARWLAPRDVPGRPDSGRWRVRWSQCLGGELQQQQRHEAPRQRRGEPGDVRGRLGAPWRRVRRSLPLGRELRQQQDSGDALALFT